MNDLNVQSIGVILYAENASSPGVARLAKEDIYLHLRALAKN